MFKVKLIKKKQENSCQYVSNNHVCFFYKLNSTVVPKFSN
jgi:hypothetical protein